MPPEHCTDMELARVPAGACCMGSSRDEWGRDDDEGPQHQMQIRGFYLARMPVTNSQYERYLASHPDTRRPGSLDDVRFGRPDQPVVCVTWQEAQQFATWVGGRLPSEAEWEYACRAGTCTNTYAGEIGDECDPLLDAIAWYRENSDRATHTVGTKIPNPWGLYDMLGNVWEWCSDWYAPYPPLEGRWSESERVVRGGCWLNGARYARCARRDEWPPNLPDERIGFRVAFDAAD
jgi:formylglycine-generating enzyme required for sulfatase activity